MVLMAELLFVLAMTTAGMRWYLRTPTHRARKNSGAHPPQVAGHGGFGMYSTSNPPLLPHALHDYREVSGDSQEPEGPDPQSGGT